MNKEVKYEGVILPYKNEDMLKDNRSTTGLLPSADDLLLHICHLERHQNRLQKLNEELILAKEEANKIATKKYDELYHFAPLGYFTLSIEAEIIELNLCAKQMLGKEFSLLRNSNFVFFVSDDTKPLFNQFLCKVFYSSAKEICEVTLSRNGNTPMFVQLTGLICGNGEECFITAIDITDRKRAVEAIKESELKFRTVADQTFDWVYWMGINQQIIYMSPACKKITGYDAEEFITNPQLLQKIVHPDDSESLFHHHNQVFLDKNRNEVYDLEIRVINKENNLVWINHICRPIFDENRKYLGRRICNRNITEHKQAEKQLKLLSRAIEQSPIVVIITDKKGNIEYVNPKFTEQTGYEFDEVKGKNPRILQSGEQSDEFYEKLWSTILTGNVWHGELHNKKKNGDSYWESTVISSILNSKGEISFFLAVKEDITEKKKMVADLIDAKEQAEESDRLKSAFLANMSHEIRTPMNGIMGFAELLKEPNLSGDEQQEFITIIQKSGARMLNIINDIMSISKVESGQMEVYITESDINRQIDYIYTFFKPEAEQKGLQLIVKKSLPANEANIKTDKEKIYAILTNLVKNAIKFTPTGSIEFGYNVSTHAELEFFVKDTGPGIREEQKEFIFERFRQGSESLSRNYEGAGLGLTISKAYVEMLGGKIKVESEEGKGSTFYFTIPYLNRTAEKGAIKSLVADDKTMNLINPEVSGLKILIAEDDDISAKFLSTTIKNYSKEIMIVKNGVEAIEVCCCNPDIDLLLMDIKMPLIDGYEATRQIRLFNTSVIIIAQSAFALKGDKEKAIAAGCNDYIPKPIRNVQLTEIINKYFKK